jgi:hypothetical protein
MTINQCTHYALTRPAVFSILPGCQSRKQVEDFISYLNASEEDKDYTPFLGELKNNFKGQCVYCNHCLPCPAEIPINMAARIILLNNRMAKGAFTTPQWQENMRKIDNCTNCGHCKAHCPYGLDAPRLLKEQQEAFFKMLNGS